MRHRNQSPPGPAGPSAASIAILLFALFFSSTTLAFVGNVSLEMDELRNGAHVQQIEMQTLETSCTDADGVVHTVTTTRNQGESTEAFVERHREAVAALKEAFPPAR